MAYGVSHLPWNRLVLGSDRRSAHTKRARPREVRRFDFVNVGAVSLSRDQALPCRPVRAWSGVQSSSHERSHCGSRRDARLHDGRSHARQASRSLEDGLLHARVPDFRGSSAPAGACFRYGAAQVERGFARSRTRQGACVLHRVGARPASPTAFLTQRQRCLRTAWPES